MCAYNPRIARAIIDTGKSDMDPTFPLVPIANFIGCILVLISLSKGMFQTWNVGACSFAFWTFVLNLEIGVNSIVWSNNTNNVAPVWCDISSCPFIFPIEYEYIVLKEHSRDSDTHRHCLNRRFTCLVICDYQETFNHASPKRQWDTKGDYLS